MDRAAKEPKAKTKTPNKKKKIVSISLLVIGIGVLITGVVFLVLNLINMNRAADGEYLVTAGDWVLEGEEGVIWDFTEIGKGILTTNNHLNDYDFAWAIENDKLLMETDWLYDIENTYKYELDQGAGVLMLTDGNGEVYTFKRG